MASAYSKGVRGLYERHLSRYTFHSDEERKKCIDELMKMSENETTPLIAALYNNYVNYSNYIYAKALEDGEQKDLNDLVNRYGGVEETCLNNPYKILYCYPLEGCMRFDPSVTDPKRQNLVNMVHIIRLQREAQEALARNGGQFKPIPLEKLTKEYILKQAKEEGTLIGQTRYAARSEKETTEYFHSLAGGDGEDASMVIFNSRDDQAVSDSVFKVVNQTLLDQAQTSQSLADLLSSDTTTTSTYSEPKVNVNVAPNVVNPEPIVAPEPEFKSAPNKGGWVPGQDDFLDQVIRGQQPMYQEQAYYVPGEPMQQQPVYQQPMYQQPIYQQVYVPEQPVYQQPVYQQVYVPPPMYHYQPPQQPVQQEQQDQNLTPEQQMLKEKMEDQLSLVRVPFLTVDGDYVYPTPYFDHYIEEVEGLTIPPSTNTSSGEEYQQPEVTEEDIKSLLLKNGGKPGYVNWGSEYDPETRTFTATIDDKPVEVKESKEGERYLSNRHPNPNHPSNRGPEEDWEVIEPSQQWYFNGGRSYGYGPFSSTNGYTAPGFGMGSHMRVGQSLMPNSNGQFKSAQDLGISPKDYIKATLPGLKPKRLEDFLREHGRSVDPAPKDNPNPNQGNTNQPEYGTVTGPVGVPPFPDPLAASMNPRGGMRSGLYRNVNVPPPSFATPSSTFDLRSSNNLKRERWHIPEDVENLHVDMKAVTNMDMSLFEPTQEELDEGLCPFVTLEINGHKLCGDDVWEEHIRKLTKKKKGPRVLYEHLPAVTKLTCGPETEEERLIKEGKLWSERIWLIDENGNKIKDITHDMMLDDEEEEKEKEKKKKEKKESESIDLDLDLDETMRKAQSQQQDVDEMAYLLAKELRRYNPKLADTLLWAKGRKSSQEFYRIKEDAIKQLMNYRNADPMVEAKSLVSAGLKFMVSPPLKKFALSDLKNLADKSQEMSKRMTEEEVVKGYQDQANVVYEEIEKSRKNNKSDEDTIVGILKRLSYMHVQLLEKDNEWVDAFNKKVTTTSNDEEELMSYCAWKRFYQIGWKGDPDEFDRAYDKWWNGHSKAKTLEEKVAVLNKKRAQLAGLQQKYLTVLMMTADTPEKRSQRMSQIVSDTLNKFSQGMIRPDMTTWHEYAEGLGYVHSRALENKADRQAQEFKRLYDPDWYSQLVTKSAMEDAKARGETYVPIDSKEYNDKRQRYIDTIFTDMRAAKPITKTQRGLF